jgi:hypothetical protein
LEWLATAASGTDNREGAKEKQKKFPLSSLAIGPSESIEQPGILSSSRFSRLRGSSSGLLLNAAMRAPWLARD